MRWLPRKLKSLGASGISWIAAAFWGYIVPKAGEAARVAVAVRRHSPARLQTGGGAVLVLLRSQRVVALLTWRPTALPDCPNSSILAHTECFKIAVNSSGLLQEVRCSFRLKYPQSDQLNFSFQPIFNHIGVSASTMSPPYFITCPLAGK